jgi:hypothetical protein
VARIQDDPQDQRDVPLDAYRGVVELDDPLRTSEDGHHRVVVGLDVPLQKLVPDRELDGELARRSSALPERQSWRLASGRRSVYE